jgi:hypothetical protein
MRRVLRNDIAFIDDAHFNRGRVVCDICAIVRRD